VPCIYRSRDRKRDGMKGAPCICAMAAGSYYATGRSCETQLLPLCDSVPSRATVCSPGS
jgi:hypothetical protein